MAAAVEPLPLDFGDQPAPPQIDLDLPPGPPGELPGLSWVTVRNQVLVFVLVERNEEFEKHVVMVSHEATF